MPTRFLANTELSSEYLSAVSGLFEFVRSSSKPEIVLGLTGGRTVGACFEVILDRADDLSLDDWSRVRFFVANDNRVPLSDPDSNYGLVDLRLLNPLRARGLIAEGQCFPPPVHAGSAEEWRRQYSIALERVGGRFDVVILSSGEDGHMAGLFPQHPALGETGIGYVAFDDSPKPPAKRISATLPSITSAKLGILLFVGEGKRDALTRFLDPSVAESSCPIKFSDSISERYIVTDQVDVLVARGLWKNE